MSSFKRQHAMTGPEGVAMAVQLDGMIKALAATEERASVVGDNTVIQLLSLLEEAKDVANLLASRMPIPEQRNRYFGS